jgi:RNA polymerase subunit RPABC4/transcription elongation factor Spt4/type II secretory pathway pseudopilin PulG
MALIKCNNCEKMISDKAKICPQCGQPVILETTETEENTVLLCEECGTVIPDGMEACPNCGCPVSVQEEVTEAPQKVEVTSVKLQPIAKNTKKYIVIAVVAIIAIIAAIFIGNNVKQKKLAEEEAQRKEAYASNLETASFTMLMGAIDAEKAGNLIKKVWYNEIYGEYDSETSKYTSGASDFNEALSNLFADSDFRTKISSIETNQDTVASLMKKLKNPPEEYEDAYDAIKELYDAYTKLTNLATNPSGNLQSFSENFNAADSETVNCYEALQMYID